MTELFSKRVRSEREIGTSKRAILAARKQIAANGVLHRDDLAKEFEVTPNAVSRALVAVKHGTEEEIAAIERGEMGAYAVYLNVVSRVPVEARMKTKSPATRSADARSAMRNDAEMWKTLREAVDLICGLPRPVDMVALARRNRRRTVAVDSRIMDAYTWLSEFSDEWTK